MSAVSTYSVRHVVRLDENCQPRPRPRLDSITQHPPLETFAGLSGVAARLEHTRLPS